MRKLVLQFFKNFYNKITNFLKFSYEFFSTGNSEARTFPEEINKNKNQVINFLADYKTKSLLLKNPVENIIIIFSKQNHDILTIRFLFNKSSKFTPVENILNNYLEYFLFELDKEYCVTFSFIILIKNSNFDLLEITCNIPTQEDENLWTSLNFEQNLKHKINFIKSKLENYNTEGTREVTVKIKRINF